MSQISPPMRILLVGAVAFLAAWMLFLKPSDGTETAATPTTPAAPEAPAAQPKTDLGKAVQSAEGASDSSDARNAAGGADSATAPSTSSATTPSTSSATTPATESPAKPAPAKQSDPELAKLPDWLRSNLDKKVVAILFVNGDAADDRRTRSALKGAYRADGKVITHTVPISKISRFGAVARGVDVQQSPTLMVIDRDRGANALVGYSSRETINQAIVDGLLATDNPTDRVDYLQRLQAQCQIVSSVASLNPTTALTPKELKANMASYLAALTSAKKRVGVAGAPAGFKDVGRSGNAYLASEIGVANKVRSTGVRGGQVDPKAIRTATSSNDKLQQRTLLEMNAAGVSACN